MMFHFRWVCWHVTYYGGFPGGVSDKESRSSRFDPWVKEIPWRREGQPTPVFLPGEFHGHGSFSSVQFSSVTQLCLTLCNPMNRSTPGFPVHHKLLEFTQTHVHRVSDAIQPSHPLLSPSPPAPNSSQHQGLFQ